MPAPAETSAARSPLFFVTVGVAIVLAFTLALLIFTKPISQDEGVFLTIGKYVAQGDVLYRDFFDHKPPGIHVLLAGLFAVFGANLWIAKTALWISLLISALFIKLIGDRLQPGTGWIATVVWLFLMTQFEGYYLLAEPFLILPLVIAFWLLIRTDLKARQVLLAGFFLGIAIVFKQTAVLSVIPMLVLTWREGKRTTSMMIIGILIPLLAGVLYVYSHAIVQAAWQQIVTLTITNYPRESFGIIANALRHNFGWTLPVWIFAALGLTAARAHRTTIMLLALLPIPALLIRHYPHYWVQILPFIALIAASTIVDWRSKKITLATLAFCVAVAGGKIGQDVPLNHQTLQAQFEVATIFSQEPADRLLAENQFTAFYFLLPFRPLNKYVYLTEITAAERAEEKTIADLSKATSVLVLWPMHDRAYAKNLERVIFESTGDEVVWPELGLRAVTPKPAVTH